VNVRQHKWTRCHARNAAHPSCLVLAKGRAGFACRANAAPDAISRKQGIFVAPPSRSRSPSSFVRNVKGRLLAAKGTSAPFKATEILGRPSFYASSAPRAVLTSLDILGSAGTTSPSKRRAKSGIHVFVLGPKVELHKVARSVMPNSALLSDTYTSPLRARRGAAKRER
jgi:hypothetical protein